MQTAIKHTLLTAFFLPIVISFSHTLTASQQTPSWKRSHSHPSLKDLEKQLFKPQRSAKRVRRCSLKTLRTPLALLAAVALIFGGIVIGLKGNTVGRQAEELLHESREMVGEGKMVVNKTDIMIDEALSLLRKLHNLTDSLPHFPDRPNLPDRPGWSPGEPRECSPATISLLVQADKAIQASCRNAEPSDYPTLCPYMITLVQHLQTTCQNQTVTVHSPLATKVLPYGLPNAL